TRDTINLMDPDIRKTLIPGAKVAVTQQIAARNYTWTTTVRGTVIEFGQQETGSWYAHSKDDRLWLDRLTLRKGDGEITTLILDDYSHVEVEGQAASGEGQAASGEGQAARGEGQAEEKPEETKATA